MQIHPEPDVQTAIEALNGAGIPMNKLVGVAARVAELAPHIWGTCQQEQVHAFVITSSPLSAAT